MKMYVGGDDLCCQKCAALIRNVFGRFRTTCCPEMPETFLIGTSVGCFDNTNLKERYSCIFFLSYSKTAFFDIGSRRKDGLGKFPGKAAGSGEKGIRMDEKKKGCCCTPSGILNSLIVCVLFDTATDTVGWVQQIADGTVVV